MGLLLPLDDRIKERVFLYADDVVLFLRPQQQDLELTKGILEIFARVSGLRTNMDKCHISPIQCNLEDTVSLLQHFPGKLDLFPTKYLGIPLSLKKLRKTVTEVDLCTSLPSGIPEPGRLPCSVTRLQLLGGRDSAVRGKDSLRIRTIGSN